MSELRMHEGKKRLLVDAHASGAELNPSDFCRGHRRLGQPMDHSDQTELDATVRIG